MPFLYAEFSFDSFVFSVSYNIKLLDPIRSVCSVKQSIILFITKIDHFKVGAYEENCLLA